jgi:hypothetical protein
LREIIGDFKEKVYLCSDDTLHPIATPAAMAQERLRLCTDILQQQSVEA